MGKIPYAKMYHMMIHASEDVIALLEHTECTSLQEMAVRKNAISILMRAELEAEDLFIETTAGGDEIDEEIAAGAREEAIATAKATAKAEAKRRAVEKAQAELDSYQ